MLALGNNLDTGKPVMLDWSVFDAHTVLRGMTRSGKTILQADLLTSYLQMNRPLLVIDLAGDLYLWNVIREQCQKNNRLFQTVSVDPSEQTLSFNPLQGFDTTGVDVARNAVTLVAGLGLDYGAGYGKGFFSAQNLEVALQAFESLSAPSRPPFELEEVSDAVSRISRRRRGEQTELSLALRLLSSYAKLDANTTESLDIAEGIQTNSVMYFFLDTLFQGPVKSVGALAAFSAVMAMIRRKREAKEERKLLIPIDEFASVAGVSGFTDAIPQMLKYGVSFFLTHQSESQLIDNRDQGLSQIVFENCATRIYLTCVGDDEVNLQRESRSVVATQESRTESGFFSTSVTKRDVEEFELSLNRIKDVSSTAFQGFLMQRDGKGFQNPTPFSFSPPPLKTHESLSSTPIPRSLNAGAQKQTGPARDTAWAARIREAIERQKQREDWQSAKANRSASKP